MSSKGESENVFERAIAKLEPNGPLPTTLRKPLTVDGSESGLTAHTEAGDPNGANGTRDRKKSIGSTVVQSVATDSHAPAIAARKPLKLKLRAIGAQDYGREGVNRSELPGTFRHIKRPLLANVYGHGVPAVNRGRRIMVTSALPGEGKTFTSIHLALSIAAEVDTSVILVDGDIIRPSIHTVLGVGQRPGIADWFADNETPFTQIVSSTTMDDLKIVTAGQWKLNTAEMLASRAMAQFFDALSAAYPNTILVVDSPPLLPSSESAALAKSMGQVVLVVGSGVTSQTQVNQALEMLEGEQAISLVLNRSRNSSSYANYGY